MRFAAAAIVLLAAPLAAAAPAKTNKTVAAKAPAKSKSKTAAAASTAGKPAPAPVVAPPRVEPERGPRLRHETIGIAPGYGSVEADAAQLARKDDDTAIGRSLAVSASTPAAGMGPFAGVETTVVKKKPQATGRIRVSFDVDRRGRVVRPLAVGFDRTLDRAIEAQLKSAVLPSEYFGQHVDTVLAFQKGKLIRR
jgi:hypothetical protein